MKTRPEIIAEARRLRGEIEQIFNDTAHWNAAHPGETPIDPDPEDELTRLAQSLDKLIESEALRSPHGPN